VIPAALAAGTASYYLVELPFLSLKSGWRRNPRSPEDRVALPASLGSRDVAVSRSE
jgi:hypothetical protein